MEIGSLVICVDDRITKKHEWVRRYTRLPVKGRIYTVTGFKTDFIVPGLTGVYIEECSGKVPTRCLKTGKVKMVPLPFDVHRFREVISPSEISTELINELEGLI